MLTSAQIAALYAQAAPLICRDLSVLAPGFLRIVTAGIAQCNAQGLDVVVMETQRSDALEAIYFQIGTTKAPTAMYSWHGFCLAVDLGSRTQAEDAWADVTWCTAVVTIMKGLGCAWGGDWLSIDDKPHFQPAGVKPTPSDEARALYASGGLPAVWTACGMAA